MEIQLLEQNSNVIIEAYKIEGGAQSLFDKIAEQARSIVPDLSTDKGRKAIASMARKVASTKTAFDAHGKELKEQYTAITSKIDADRKLFRDQCDALRDEIRKPLTDWENAEKQRVVDIELRIASLKQEFGSSLSIDIQNDINRIDSIEIDDSFMEFQDKAKLQKYETLEFLNKLLIEAKDKEEKEAELERLRIAEQQRLQQEHEARIASEATEKAQREAEEKARLEAERVQREKLEAEQREAKLKYDAEQALIREEQLKRQAEIDKALAKERAEAQAKQAEIDRQKAIEDERKRIEMEQLAKDEAERKAQEAREADKAHKKQVCDSILAEFSKLNIDEKTGKDLIKAIYNNQIPNITIKF